MVGYKFNQQHLASVTFHQVAANHLITLIVGPFHKHAGTNCLDEPQGIVLSKNHHLIDAGKRGQNHGARGFVLDGQMFAFQACYGSIAVEPDNETITGLARLSE